MIEVLWHGRGGQGAFTAARLLGAAAMEAGLFSLAFPSFGPERRGAPMRAFTKMSTEPIGDRSASAQADFVVYLDETLLGCGWEAELKPGGRVLVNSARRFDDPRIMAIDADGVSAAVLGRPIPNTAFLGALARLGEAVSLADVESAVRSSMAARLHEPNCAIASQAYGVVDGLLTKGQDDWGGHAEAAGAAAGAAVQADAGKGAGAPDVVRPEGRIPRLRSQLAAPDSLDPADYARTTCFTAGHLVTKNAGWRSQRPMVDADACTACGQCVQYCPDGSIFLKGRRVGSASEGLQGASDCSEGPRTRTLVRDEGMEVQDDASCKAAAAARPAAALAQPDLDYCKGCGICAKMCRFGAIAMVPERQAEGAGGPAGPAAGQRKEAAA